MIEILECAGATATSLLAKLNRAGIIERVVGQGSGSIKENSRRKKKGRVRDNNYVEEKS